MQRDESGKINAGDIGDGTCVVCCRNSVRIFAVGECDHPVCYECATRMRVLGNAQNELCAICRTSLPKVIFVRERKSYATIADNTYSLCDAKFHLYFEDEDIRKACYRLLEHRCHLCRARPNYPTFSQLKDHMRREHERHYCDLCVEHLTAFTHERKCYSRADLARHRRIGDVDDTSHRGHPLCEFCDVRYVDNDELFRHLRREHFYCHFCDADGLHHYYSDYKYLREHFRVEHFLCDDDACREERFTTAFRTEIDLKAHRAAVHSRNLTKAQSKQARTLELEFTITPRVPGGGSISTATSSSGMSIPSMSIGYASGSRQVSNANGETYTHDGDVSAPSYRKDRRGDHGRNDSARPSSSRNNTSSRRDPFDVTYTGGHHHQHVTSIDITPDIDLNSEQFPMLGDGNINTKSSSLSLDNTRPDHDTLARKLAKINRFTVGSNVDGLGDTEFPALSSSSTNNSQYPTSQKTWTTSTNLVVKSTTTTTKPSSSNQVTAEAPPKSKKTLTVKLNSKDDFPTLVTKKLSTPTVSLQVSRTSIVPSGNQSNSSCVNKRQVKSGAQPVVTRMTGSQNITFLNAPAVKEKAKKDGKVSGDGKLKNGKMTNEKSNDLKSEEVWPVLKKGNSQKCNVKIKIKDPDTTGKSKSQKEIPPTSSLERSESRPSDTVVENGNSRPKPPIENGTNSVESGFSGIMSEDFPNLPSRNLKTKKPQKIPTVACVKPLNCPPPGFANNLKPPPGFALPTSATLNPPPGFNASAVLPSPIDVPAMTFTSSNGQYYVTSTNSKKYHQPADFQMRNQALMERLSVFLNDKDKFATFRLLSGFYRKGDISADDFYRECCDILGVDEYSRIFPELIVLLPDIQKQQMLMLVHKELGSTSTTQLQLLVCATCRQVLSADDFRTHMNHHSHDEDFPSLPGSGGELSTSKQQKKKATWVEKMN